MNTSKIEWTDKTWNPVTGCTKVSQGCKNCYAERIHERFNGQGSFKKVLAHPERLDQPLKWKKPFKIFVNSMSDLFHEDVPFEFIMEVLFVIRKCPQHTFQILTKRPQRMLDFFTKYAECGAGHNIWLGVSVEDQATADERIPLLLQVPAAVRFLSCEPLLWAIDLHIDWLWCYSHINWIIAGGESGPGARPMHPDWAISIRDQCQVAGVPFFFKQWGEWSDVFSAPDFWDEGTGLITKNDYVFKAINGFKTLMSRVGKKAAGRLLDGKEYNEFPQLKTVQ